MTYAQRPTATIYVAIDAGLGRRTIRDVLGEPVNEGGGRGFRQGIYFSEAKVCERVPDMMGGPLLSFGERQPGMVVCCASIKPKLTQQRINRSIHRPK